MGPEDEITLFSAREMHTFILHDPGRRSRCFVATFLPHCTNLHLIPSAHDPKIISQSHHKKEKYTVNVYATQTSDKKKKGFTCGTSENCLHITHDQSCTEGLKGTKSLGKSEFLICEEKCLETTDRTRKARKATPECSSKSKHLA